MSEIATSFGIDEALKELGIEASNSGTSTGSEWFSGTDHITSVSPVDNSVIGKVSVTTREDYDKVLETATEAFKHWRTVPAPKRGDIVRQFGDELRRLKEPLGKLVSFEMGKSYQEGLGEVQEMIDICDFAVGLSRQLYGFTMHSERPNHRMYDQYHPLGVVGVITAFNFPVAVWSWNAALAWVCGDVTLWKPSSKVPLCAVACQKIVEEVFAKNDVPEGVSTLLIGDEVNEKINNHPQIPLVAFTGSTEIGRHVGQVVAKRFGRSLLELGGNNAIIITPSADLKTVVPGAVFGAVGTAG